MLNMYFNHDFVVSSFCDIIIETVMLLDYLIFIFQLHVQPDSTESVSNNSLNFSRKVNVKEACSDRPNHNTFKVKCTKFKNQTV